MHAANRRIYGQWTSSIPSRFIAELPAEHVEVETSMSGGASLWRSQFSEQPDTFAHAGRGAGRGPGWQRERRRLQPPIRNPDHRRSGEHTSELQSLMRNTYAVILLKKNKIT